MGYAARGRRQAFFSGIDDKARVKRQAIFSRIGL
jgi:hypothetical protein